MIQRLVIPLLAVVAFGAGFGARMWTEGDRALPPPPAMGSEFLPPSTEKKPAQKAVDRIQLVAEIEKNLSQVDVYQKQVQAIESGFEKAFVALLTPEQMKIYEAREADKKKWWAERNAKAAANPLPRMSDEEIAKLRQRPFETVFWKICYAPGLEQRAHDFKLDADQQAKLRDLSIDRRTKYIGLIDSTPSPTFKLTLLAASVQRLIEPASASPPPAK